MMLTTSIIWQPPTKILKISNRQPTTTREHLKSTQITIFPCKDWQRSYIMLASLKRLLNIMKKY